MIPSPPSFIKAISLPRIVYNAEFPDGEAVASQGADVAVRIERVEREFILGAAADSGIELRIQNPGRLIRSRILAIEKDKIVLSLPDSAPAFPIRGRVSLFLDFRGQGVAFETSVLSREKGELGIAFPESMYRSLSRRWPRVAAPKDVVVEFLLPDAQLKLSCPESDEWTEVELPELREGLDSQSLAALIDSFREKAAALSSEGRVVMYKNREPADAAEQAAAKFGRVLYAPSTLSSLPISDPYPAGRIVTLEMASDLEGPAAAAIGSSLSARLKELAAEGVSSILWSPVLYYRYVVGMVIMSRSQGALDFGAVDLAWEFSRVLAYFLKRHGYFADSGEGEEPTKGGVVDASPSGLLAAVPRKGPNFMTGSILRLRLGVRGKTILCSARVARRYEEGGMRFYGIAFIDVSAADMSLISSGLYGDDELGSVPGGA